jgi:hypothetical protein
MWAQILQQIINGFILLRDLFGYVLPGSTFFFLGIHSGFIKIDRVLFEQEIPAWGVVVFVIAFSYIVGHFLVAAGHAFQNITRDVLSLRRRKDAPRSNPLRNEVEILYYRRLYPELFKEVDRRSTLATFRTGLGASFLLGSWFYSFSSIHIALLLVGLVFLMAAYSGQKHVELYRLTTIRAALRAERKERPKG